MKKKTSIHIGADKETLREVRAAIHAILKETVPESVAVEALRTLVALTQVKGVSINNCIFRG